MNKLFLQRAIIAVTIIGILAIVLLLVRHKKPESVAVPLTTKRSDATIGVYTDNVANKQSIRVPAVSTPTPVSVAAPAGCSLVLSIAKKTASSGTGSYTVTVSNAGKTTCANASLSLYYDPAEQFASATPAATSDGYYWVFGGLAYKQSKIISLSTTIQSSSAAPLQGCLSADNGSDACTTAGNSSAPAAMVASSASVVLPAVTDTTKIPISSGHEAGVWEWNDVSGMSSANMQNIVKAASANGFNVIYLTIDRYLDLAYETDSTQRAKDIASYSANLESFIALAHQYGIAVDAEAGWRDWGESAQRQKAVDIMSYVSSFNNTHPAGFRGMQYDIESYLLPQYSDNQATVLQNYVGLVDILQKQAAKENLPLTMVLPHFYDRLQQWTPEITYGGATNYAYNILLSILGRKAGNRMIIMSYRNTAEGDDGAIALAQTEIQDAAAAGNGTKIIVAQETGDVTPAYVTFSNTSRQALFTQVAALNSAFGDQSSYGGIAIDYLDPFLKLK